MYASPDDATEAYQFEKYLNRQLRQARELRDAYERDATLGSIVDHVQEELTTVTKQRCDIRNQERGWKLMLNMSNRRIPGKMYSLLPDEIVWRTPRGNNIYISNKNIRGYTERNNVFTLKTVM